MKRTMTTVVVAVALTTVGACGAEEYVTVTPSDHRFECLIDLGLRGNASDGKEAVYATRGQLDQCANG